MNTRAVNAILELVADAELAGSADAYHAELLAALARVFPCDVLNFNEFQVGENPDPPGVLSVTCTVAPPIEPRGAIEPALLEAFVRHMSEHPLIRLQAAGDCSPHRLSDATSMHRFRRGSLFGEFFGPAALNDQLTLGLEGPPQRLIGIWVSRTRHDFSEEDLLLGELLRPHLEAGERAVRRAAARAALTDREREVLDIVASGASNAAVAEALVMSAGTVKKHLDNIYAKLGVGSRSAAADRVSSGPAGRRG
jgi:DNA-binding CsgD family transcriptional regulator